LTTNRRETARIETVPDELSKGAQTGMQLLGVVRRGLALSTPPDSFRGGS
jgi:hypothetical protein